MSFQDLALAEPLLRAIQDEGYSIPTPIQAEAIPHVIAGRDLIGTAQTGTGKTAAFALPILHQLIAQSPQGSNFRKPRVLIISPTRELASQIGESFEVYGRHSGLRQTVVYGGVSQVPQVRALRRGVDILVATPGRLLDLFQQNCLRLDAVSILVLDEADRMLDMGFLPDIRRIIDKIPQPRQTLLFSATMPPAIERLTAELLRDPAHVRIAPATQTADLVSHSVCHVAQGSKPDALAAYLTSRPIERALVFTRTKQSADRVAKRLTKGGVSADAIHGNKTQASRQRTLAAFRSNRTAVLVATDVAARGLDVDGISHVVNYDLPMEPETYVHRIGRTGRAGASGVAMSFCDPQQRKLLTAIERLLRRKLPIEQFDGGQATSGPATVPPRLDGQSAAPATRTQHQTENHKSPPAAQRPSGRKGDGRRFESRGPARPFHKRPGGKPALARHGAAAKAESRLEGAAASDATSDSAGTAARKRSFFRKRRGRPIPNRPATESSGRGPQARPRDGRSRD